MRALCLSLCLLAGCSCAPPSPMDAGAPPNDVGPDAPDVGEDRIDAPLDAAIDAPSDAGPSCLDTHAAGDRYSVGDDCNFCECTATGEEVCTDRTCSVSIGGCSYDGTSHAYGDRFPSTDGCNECTCAASGLACTRRTACAPSDEGAILLENLNAPCGDDPTFTAGHVLEGLREPDFVAPFLFQRDRPSYPEVRPDTTARIRVVYDGGIIACRIPSPDQPALDILVRVEWMTEDGSFDEGFLAYLRRNNFGFLDTWMIEGSVPLGSLDGTYTPPCPIDPRGYSFSLSFDPDGHATGEITRACETDIALTVGTVERPAL